MRGIQYLKIQREIDAKRPRHHAKRQLHIPTNEMRGEEYISTWLSTKI
jgi:hypothetical protein